MGRFREWIDHKIELNDRELKEVITVTRNLELDCEKRVIKLVEKNGLNFINVKEYIQSANTYIGFYTILADTRKWYLKAPYEINEVISSMPNKFLSNYDILSIKYHDLVMKHCF
jgi:hypothetical protein